MPSLVIAEKCDGCKGKTEPLCEQICPMDIMKLDPATGKARNIAPRDCWDCMACVKSCPNQAIITKIPYQIGGYGAKLVPLMSETSIIWTLTFPDGSFRQVTMPIRKEKFEE
ncbi:MAG: 4Fe-4S dicluster domain-containing protein [Candidatus Nanopusillus acidilobi]